MSQENSYETKHIEDRLKELRAQIMRSGSYPTKLFEEWDKLLMSYARIKWAQMLDIHPDNLYPIKEWSKPTSVIEKTEKARSCNRHNDCEKAEEEVMKRRNITRDKISGNFHCHDDECEDCFGC